MRILYISDPGTVGGATRSLVDVVTEMINRGHEVIVCTSQQTLLNTELDNLNIKSFNCGHKSVMNPKSPYKWKRPLKYPYEMLMYYWSLPKALKNIEANVDLKTIDVIHTNSARNDIGCVLKKKYGIPHVMHIREFGQEDFNCITYRPFYYSFLNRNVDKFIAISNAVRDSWISKGIDKNKIVTIYNGIKFTGSDAHKAAHNDIKFVIVGGICEAKGQLDAVKAISCLNEDVRKNVKLDIIGWEDPKYKNKIIDYIKNNNLNDIINILPPQHCIHQLLNNYDIGLMCSKSEGFGRVTAEYMFAGLPVIASDTGANTELVENMKTGLLYKNKDIYDLSNKILLMIKNKELRFELGANGQKKAREEYTISKNVDSIIKIYKTIK